MRKFGIQKIDEFNWSGRLPHLEQACNCHRQYTRNNGTKIQFKCTQIIARAHNNRRHAPQTQTHLNGINIHVFVCVVSIPEKQSRGEWTGLQQESVSSTIYASCLANRWLPCFHLTSFEWKQVHGHWTRQFRGDNLHFSLATTQTTDWGLTETKKYTRSNY